MRFLKLIQNIMTLMIRVFLLLQGYILLRILFFGMMLLSNAVVWTFFAKALQQSDSLTATVISSASNYIFSVGTQINHTLSQ